MDDMSIGRPALTPHALDGNEYVAGHRERCDVRHMVRVQDDTLRPYRGCRWVLLVERY